MTLPPRVRPRVQIGKKRDAFEDALLRVSPSIHIWSHLLVFNRAIPHTLHNLIPPPVSCVAHKLSISLKLFLTWINFLKYVGLDQYLSIIDLISEGFFDNVLMSIC